MFFPNKFHVSADTERGLIRISSRMSEESVYEYWLHPSSLADFVAAETFEEWTGTEEFRVKVRNNGAVIGIKTSEGVTYIRCSESHMLLLKAHTKAALYDLGEDFTGVEESTLPSHINLEVIHRMQAAQNRELLAAVDNLISERLSRFSEQLLRSMEERIKNIPVAFAQPTSAPVVSENIPSNEPTFIPLDLIKNNMQGRMDVQQDTGDDTLGDAVAALKKMKQGDKK